MAEIAPFRGIRYDPAVVGEISRVVSPPYDIISPEDRVYYHALHPSNFVRLVLGEEFETDSESDNRFTRARGYLDNWLAKGILKQDETPAIYLYRQRFERDGRLNTVRGFTCAVRVHDYADRVILPHEDTLAKPKSQLIRLMRQTRANLDSIYGLYADPAGELSAAMERAMSRPPALEATDKNGVAHSQWVIADPVETAVFVEFLRDKPIAIADGHHRYETALAYRSEGRERHGSGLASEYTLMTLVNVHEKDMTVFPTHRVVDNVAPELLDKLDTELGKCFDIAESSAPGLLADMARRGAIGMYRPGRAVTLKRADGSDALAGLSEAGRNLELNILHKLVLARILGIDEDHLRNQTHILYTRDPVEAMRLVDSGERQIAFLLNHIDVRCVLDVAAAGERMPQKATYFYPKLISGMVLRRFDER